MTRADDMVALYRSGLTMEEIGRRYGVTRQRVYHVLSARGVGRKASPRHVSAPAFRRLARGRTVREVAALTGFSRQWVWNHAREAGVALVRVLPAAPPCGTVRGYSRHRRRGESCARCRAASTANAREMNRERRRRGLCWNCTAPAVSGRTMCEKHLAGLRAARRRGTLGEGTPRGVRKPCG